MFRKKCSSVKDRKLKLFHHFKGNEQIESLPFAGQALRLEILSQLSRLWNRPKGIRARTRLRSRDEQLDREKDREPQAKDQFRARTIGDQPSLAITMISERVPLRGSILPKQERRKQRFFFRLPTQRLIGQISQQRSSLEFDVADARVRGISVYPNTNQSRKRYEICSIDREGSGTKKVARLLKVMN